MLYVQMSSHQVLHSQCIIDDDLGVGPLVRRLRAARFTDGVPAQLVLSSGRVVGLVESQGA